MPANHPSSVLFCVAGVECGSMRVQVRQVFERCSASVPLNQVGVGGSFTHG